MRRRLVCVFCLCLVSLVGFGCSEEPVTGSDPINCSADELYDHVNDVCVPRRDDGAEPDVGGVDDVEEAPDGADDEDVEPVEPDTGPDDENNGIDPECDKDGDGDLSYECGGMDCDDEDPNRSSRHLEFCDGIDNNCSGVADDYLDCTFYAHTSDALYKIDPFKMTADKEADLLDGEYMPVGLLDIDTHPSGTLYGVARRALYAFHDFENYWIQVASLPDVGDANGLAIDNDGTAYVTAEDELLRFDLSVVEERLAAHGFDESRFSSIHLSPTTMQITGGEFYSSGDCVVNKQNTLFMTSKHDRSQDHLIEIDRSTGEGRVVGPMGISKVYGLTAGWNQLFGTTSQGELIAIDRITGASEVLHVFTDKRWYGTASTPQR